MRRRHLDPEERKLWEAVAKTAKPLAGRRNLISGHGPAHGQAGPASGQTLAQSHGQAPAVAGHPAPKPAPGAARIAPFSLGQRAAPKPQAPLAGKTAPALVADHPLSMDAKTHKRMTSGKLAPQARLDLHGLNLTQAHGALIRFILHSQSKGHRLVLVITGKGKGSPEHGQAAQRSGALRHQLPHWLALAPLGPMVQQIAQAHLRHGGLGAYYVYLRRSNPG